MLIIDRVLDAAEGPRIGQGLAMRIRKRGRKNDATITFAGKQSIDGDTTQWGAGARQRVGVP
ncbi:MULTISPECIES: hypothetical protein [Bradyrhizobium]|uniref:hypothetical protein n=1 Tax=Bradyrhizobium TaxID=374 RepID=UPI00047FD62F|nr:MULTISPECIES: hypothetical protein [Bradyrhizobium]MCS3452248.1 electron transfer flavoprotein alpha/beta subunit [Bradyrhizobium elkanii]MCS3565650.1 electron transfer flavoprotein alpha/beta subunit [Bradyrhizobium elkanii]MCW2153618.1 electron transfer flavoprotein alpha/beta subunit [Bradyrhizobium elkanii]MCW2356687.1 electron transfer flavoprotein alpha/beta subunit [Bradyrhizobium elkanii]MCW2377349.1 electron transfer flavoprotein alpha/beta subunit [Bradyrhizobium elkanii]